MLDLSRQYAAHRDQILAALAAACDSQRFILGPEVEAFESAAALACHVPHAVGCASGTDALWLALAAAGIGSLTGSPIVDAVITSPFSFFASASAILRAGARPLFADIDPFTFNLSPAAAEEALLRAGPSLSVRAILPVHLYGQCADFDAFTAIQRRRPGLLLVEDAAQAFGAAWSLHGAQPVSAGALGDAAAFSFYPTKNLSAFGDAGLLTTRSTALATHARSLRAHGMTRRYFHDEVGWNSRLDTLQAAVLLAKLPYLSAWNQRRRDLAARYSQRLLAAGIATLTSPESPHTIADGVVLPYTDPRAQPIFHQYVIRAPRRDALRAHLATAGIASEIYYPLPLHLQQALSHLNYRTGDFPEAERAATEVLALPLHPDLRESEQDEVVATIRHFYS